MCNSEQEHLVGGSSKHKGGGQGSQTMPERSQQKATAREQNCFSLTFTLL